MTTHFDDRAVDAILEQTLSLLLGHLSAAPLHILKEQHFVFLFEFDCIIQWSSPLSIRLLILRQP